MSRTTFWVPGIISAIFFAVVPYLMMRKGETRELWSSEIAVLFMRGCIWLIAYYFSFRKTIKKV